MRLRSVLSCGLVVWGVGSTRAGEGTPRPGDEPVKTPPAWKVDSPPGDFVEAAIDTTEGTWMSLDVSPDGRTIVFDLLGDLYTLPVEGGEARALTGGVSWDMQPRFSPDGTRVAFTSDRGGGDNIWVMPSAGGEPEPVTDEKYRLLNQPAWTRDGRAIVARKHFTSRRSLGAGEIWLYHVGVGITDGVRLTTKPTDQKDVNEPALSPDGRFLYYTWDTTPGAVWEYNKDSTGEIFAISRLDLETGETLPWVSGPGGAVRPTPSPDGRSLAFVRRDQFKTCLYVQDIASGRLTKLADSLERDMQEAWSIHGLYPAFAWTPDSKNIIFYARGGLRSIDVGSRDVRDIPFRVAGTRRVAKAVRFEVDVAPARFPVRMLRGVEVSPDGGQVAYSALGHVYVRDLPDGEPRRLTTASDAFESFPSFSRDGSSIVFVAWNDERQGEIRVCPARGGEGRAVTREPGVYVDPVFSPDGGTIVFGRVSGGWLLAGTHSSQTGVFAIPTDGGEPRLISREGTDPHFGRDPGRVFLVRSAPDKEHDHTSLVSLDLSGADQRTHATSQDAVEMRVSPDGRWVCFVEGFRAYVAPLAVHGRAVELGPKAKGVPIVRASSDAGVGVRFSGDSGKLHWSLGPTLSTLDLSDAFARLARPGAAGEDADHADAAPPDELAVRTPIGFDAPSDVPSGTIALRGATIIPMAGDAVLRDATIIVSGNRVEWVGPDAQAKVPAGAREIDARGRFVLPGFIDVHAHGSQGQAGITPQQNWGQHANLAFGVTTIHDPSNDTSAIFAASELQRAGLVLQPRTFSTGTILYGASGSFRATVDSLDDAMFHLARMKAVGAFSVKSYNQPRRDQRQQVVEAARRLGMMVVPEGGSLFQHNMTMVVDGHTGVEHSLPVERVYRDVAQLWGASSTGYTPTLLVGYGGLDAEHYWYQHEEAWKHEKLARFVPRAFLDPRSRRRTMAPDEDQNTLRSAGICKVLRDAGATVHIGAHGQLAGLGAHWELWSIAHGGLSNMQALHVATLDGARYLGLDRDLGSLEPGKLADLIVLERDPLEDIRHTDSVVQVMLNGRLYDAKTLGQIAPDPTSPRPYHFELNPGSLGVQEAYASCGGCGRDEHQHLEPRAYR